MAPINVACDWGGSSSRAAEPQATAGAQQQAPAGCLYWHPSDQWNSAIFSSIFEDIGTVTHTHSIRFVLPFCLTAELLSMHHI